MRQEPIFLSVDIIQLIDIIQIKEYNQSEDNILDITILGGMMK